VTTVAAVAATVLLIVCAVITYRDLAGTLDANHKDEGAA
jgi:hypothetical protein